MIQCHSVYKSFSNKTVINGIDIDIPNGQIFGLLGPSGAGKTTLLQLLGTLDRPDAGSVEVAGTEVLRLKGDALSDFRNRHIGFVFQFHQLLPEFTACENVMMPALIAGETFRAAEKRAMELLDYLNLANRAKHKPAELSGGEKQRVAVARALVNRPEVLLADEPSGSLDSVNRTELHKLFFDLRDRFGQTILIVTHDDELAAMSDRIVRMRDGRVCD